jgi:hypothetical protein
MKVTQNINGRLSIQQDGCLSKVLGFTFSFRMFKCDLNLILRACVACHKHNRRYGYRESSEDFSIVYARIRGQDSKLEYVTGFESYRHVFPFDVCVFIGFYDSRHMPCTEL